jgi:hypothetical protein
MPWFYGSTAEPKRIFGDDTPLMRAFTYTMESIAPGVTELRNFMVSLWDPKNDKHTWVLPDNHHVHIKVIGNVTHEFLIMGGAYTTMTKEQMPLESGISNAANIIHSIDGMVVREMGRRCDYDKNQVAKVVDLLINTGSGPDNAFSSQDKGIQRSRNINMVKKLTDHFKATGFLSARIIDAIDEDSIHYAPRKELNALVLSLPKKPFNILAVHD